jgi:hypothetical protein
VAAGRKEQRARVAGLAPVDFIGGGTMRGGRPISQQGNVDTMDELPYRKKRMPGGFGRGWAASVD